MPPTDNNNSRLTRYLVIGSTGYHGVDSVSWNVDEFPNVVDYDVVIVDVRSLDDNMLADVSNERLKELRRSLIRLIDSQGQLIVLSDNLRFHDRPDEYPGRASNYSWCPISITLSSESGESIEVIENRFPTYLSELKNWQYFVSIPRSALSSDLTDYYGSTHKTRYRIPCRPIITNRYGKTIAGVYKIEITSERGSSDYSRTRYFPDEIDIVTGEIILLPLIERLPATDSVNAVLRDLVEFQAPVPAPPWASRVIVPGCPQLESKIENVNGRIDTLLKERQHQEDELAHLYGYRKLIYSTGKELEDALSVCLETLGGIVEPAKYGEEEYVLNFNAQEHLIEVKGVQKSISLTHLRQLNDYILQFEEETNNTCKGILFGNAWRLFPPEDRGTGNKQEFPDNVIRRAVQLDIALLSSVQFYELYCLYLAGDVTGETILNHLTQCTGYVRASDLKRNDS